MFSDQYACNIIHEPTGVCRQKLLAFHQRDVERVTSRGILPFSTGVHLARSRDMSNHIAYILLVSRQLTLLDMVKAAKVVAELLYDRTRCAQSLLKTILPTPRYIQRGILSSVRETTPLSRSRRRVVAKAPFSMTLSLQKSNLVVVSIFTNQFSPIFFQSDVQIFLYTNRISIHLILNKKIKGIATINLGSVNSEVKILREARGLVDFASRGEISY